MDNLLNALNTIPAASVSYQEWINVGMGLHSEGYGCDVWDKWSRNDSRYHTGECERKWRTFKGNPNPVTGATIMQMAKQYGWKPYEGDGFLAWDDTIEYDGDAYQPKDEWNPVGELKRYLELLFEPDELVSYVTESRKDTDDRWKPLGAGCFDRTASQLIASLEKYPNDIGATVGDAKPEAGAWIRFNPVNGEGVKNENISSYRYALVESDNMPIAEQDVMYRKLELPIAVLVHSGGKSLHAIVRVDAPDYEEYRKRVEFLYDFLEKHGVPVDKQNRNPSRLSRMPGVMRNGNRQYIVAENIGRKSWTEWMDFVEGASDELPGLVSLADFKDAPPKLPEELIKGVLRCGHKMLISGSSKAGKSFLLMELCVSLAEGTPWLGFPCKRGRVLYVNLEIDPASCVNRFMNIYKAMKVPVKHMDDIVIWNLRGHAIPLDKLVPKLTRRIKNQHFSAVVIDPIYKVLTGDENSASDMGAFCNQFDRICTETGCAAIYCHHHSKGSQGSKKAMDRASGSGVFARDPDAQLDMIQLELSDDMENNLWDGNATAWRLECNLREFESFKPINFWFEYPIHRIDSTGELSEAFTEGSFEAARARNKKYTTSEERKTSIESAFDSCSCIQPVTVEAMAEYLGVTERCIRDRLKEFKSQFWCKGGIVGRVENTNGTENREKQFSVLGTELCL